MKEKEIFKNIREQIINFVPSIIINDYQKIEINKLINYLLYDCSLLFHIDKINYTYNISLNQITLIPNYIYSINQYLYLINEIFKKINIIDKKIKRLNHNELEIEIWVHNYICQNIVLSSLIKEDHSIVGPLLYNRGNNEGIAKTAHLFFKLAKLKSKILFGKLSDLDYFWNLVNIEGSNYMIDITNDNLLSKFCIRYDYFNVSCNAIKNYYKPNLNSVSDFNDCKNENDYFINNNLLIRNKKELIKFFKRVKYYQNKIVYFRFDNDDDTKYKIVNKYAKKIFVNYNLKHNLIRNIFFIEITY